MAMLPRRPLVFSLAVGIPAIMAVFAASRWLQVDDPADFDTRWTARVMFLCWTIAVACRIRLGRTPETRAWWTTGCVAFVIHVATAFARIHGWSHGRAFDHVEETSGYGPGIFVSYLFTLGWIADVLWWWLSPGGYATRSRRGEIALHGFFAFIMFNGTVVYETGPIRWVGLAVFTGLAVLLAMPIKRDLEPENSPVGLIR
ncbi:hypothetical protein [Zavarzinella formosa]|uniref:hypothetical protein n=1 Tax=Zavarzinella formosa TaxID=360055 RepID=UPI0012FA06A7|nr:hypothetical protein [Zavarzinella formosa]